MDTSLRPGRIIGYHYRPNAFRPYFQEILLDVRLRFRGIGLLLTLLICSPILAQEPETEDSHSMPGSDPHSGMGIAIENADNPATQSLPLEELQMFADVFNQIRQGYVESVPDSELFELAVGD